MADLATECLLVMSHEWQKTVRTDIEREFNIFADDGTTEDTDKPFYNLFLCAEVTWVRLLLCPTSNVATVATFV